MATLYEGSLAFQFPDNWEAYKYDDWSFYRNQFKDCCNGCKAIDFLAINLTQKTLWLIEVKDYRFHRRSKDIEMWDEMALKVLHTLSGLVALKMNPDDQSHAFAVKCLNCNKLGVVLHLEQPSKQSTLFPRAYNLANVQMKLRQLIKPINAHPKVVEINNPGGVAWTVNSI